MSVPAVWTVRSGVQSEKSAWSLSVLAVHQALSVEMM